MTDEQTELTAEERAAFAALPGERDPGILLEERTVQVLEERGLLFARSKRNPVHGVPVWALGLAASLALFVSGVATGQWMGTRNLANTMVVVQQETAMQTASLVQQTGSAYVMSLIADRPGTTGRLDERSGGSTGKGSGAHLVARRCT